jgi:hypothetical protein
VTDQQPDLQKLWDMSSVEAKGKFAENNFLEGRSYVWREEEINA